MQDPIAIIPAPENGVQFNPPPEQIVADIMGDIEKAVANLDPGDIILMGVADRLGGWNAATVVKGAHGISGVAFVGKSWGTDAKLNYGVKVMWKINIGGS